MIQKKLAPNQNQPIIKHTKKKYKEVRIQQKTHLKAAAGINVHWEKTGIEKNR